jgi:hypothetical protein
MTPLDRRADLLKWISASRRLQFRLGFALAVGTVVSIVAMQFDSGIGKLALAMLAIVAVCAYWVTGSHILDWRNRLDALDLAERKVQSGRGDPARESKRLQ